jgi:hypothetical protein
MASFQPSQQPRLYHQPSPSPPSLIATTTRAALLVSCPSITTPPSVLPPNTATWPHQFAGPHSSTCAADFSQVLSVSADKKEKKETKKKQTRDGKKNRKGDSTEKKEIKKN